MSYIIDETFGKLEFNQGWTTNYSMDLFGKHFDIELIIDNDDKSEITDNQKSSYIFFQKNKIEILKNVEHILIEYTKNYLSEYDRDEEDNDTIESSIQPTGLIFPTDDLTDGKAEFGFLFESKFDPEGGIGVKYSDGHYEISTQDIALL